MKRVIAAIDNSAASRPVLAMAQAVASALGGALDVVHVIEDGDETARAFGRRPRARLCARSSVIRLNNSRWW